MKIFMFLLFFIITGCSNDVSKNEKTNSEFSKCLSSKNHETDFLNVTILYHYQFQEGECVDKNETDCDALFYINEVENQCSENKGNHCDSAKYLSWDQAVCIADISDTQEFVEPMKLQLRFSHFYQMPIWEVTKILNDTDFQREGIDIVLDASSGQLLNKNEWGTIYRTIENEPM